MKGPPPDSPLWMDGSWVDPASARVSLDDPGLLAGLGVFETLGVLQGRPLDLSPHLERMQRGATRLELPPLEIDGLADVARRLAERVGERGWVKLIATGGGCVAAFGGVTSLPDGQPATAVLLEWRRDARDPLAGIKSLNYAPFVLGMRQAAARGAGEGLWCNSRGLLAEGCRSNLFVVDRGRLFTAAVREGILPGITRAAVIRVAKALGMQVHEGKLRIKRLRAAPEAFLTSSVAGVRPLVSFEGRPVGNGRPGVRTQSIIDALRQERESSVGLTV